MPTEAVALFSAIHSFAIRSKLRYQIIGTTEWGEISPHLFAHIVLKSSAVLTLRISEIANIEFDSEKGNYQLLSLELEDEDELDLVLAMNAGLEELLITATGKPDDSQD